jgi:hypothetical protein
VHASYSAPGIGAGAVTSNDQASTVGAVTIADPTLFAHENARGIGTGDSRATMTKSSVGTITIQESNVTAVSEPTGIGAGEVDVRVSDQYHRRQ